jgi:hypothetical protein
VAEFRDGLPPHLHPSARSKEYTPGASSIFVVDLEDFRSMTAQEVQEVFRHRHILVRKSPIETTGFNLDALEMLGSLTTKVPMQGRLQAHLLGSDVQLTK